MNTHDVGADPVQHLYAWNRTTHCTEHGSGIQTKQPIQIQTFRLGQKDLPPQTAQHQSKKR
jgi:hypothetical protein